MLPTTLCNPIVCAPVRTGSRRFCLRLGLGSVASAALAACGTKPLPAARLDGRIEAAADLNPSVAARPSPLRVRWYELRTLAAFAQADFMSLYEGDQAALGADLLAREELTVQPGARLPLVRTLQADTRFVGFVALYRDLEHAVWRASAPVQPGRLNTLVVRLDRLTLRMDMLP